MPSPDIRKSEMSAHERSLRSRLTQLIQGGGLIRGTLSERAVTCGKSNCKCARGEKHSYLYVVASEGGKLRQRSVPRKLHSEIQRWVENYQKAQQLLEEISQLYWIRVEKRGE
jgi:hypothetical protein